MPSTSQVASVLDLLRATFGDALYKEGPAKKAPKPGDLRGDDVDSDYFVN